MAFDFDDIDQWVTTDTRDGLMSRIGQNLCVGRGFSVATLNVDHLVKLEKDPEFRAAYAAQDFVVADGNPIVWMRRIAGHRTALVPGSELVEPVAEMAAQLGVPVALIGATDYALDAAAGKLSEDHKDLVVSFTAAPQLGFDPLGPEADALIERLRDSSAGLVFLALGAPKQEVFAARIRAAVPHIGILSIGAGLDFLAGSQRRAPVFVRRIAMEWAWRILMNPRRLLVRYIRCAGVLPRHIWRAYRARQEAKSRLGFVSAYPKNEGFSARRDNTQL